MFGTDALPLFGEAGFEVVGEDLPGVDITLADSLAACMGRHQPHVVVNAAGYTRVDAAESDAAEAYRVNAGGAALVAEACREQGALLVHLSTDYVFPGVKMEGYAPSDTPGPASSVYGASKLAGEVAVRTALPPEGFLLCRTQWLYGTRGPNFVQTILGLAASREEIRVVKDQWGVPTRAAGLAQQIVAILKAGARGTFHTVGAGGPVTWHTFASAIVEMAGLRCEVTPCATDEFPRPARRPQFAWLRNEGVAEDAVQPWRAALKEHLAEMGSLALDRKERA
jgi:dTDP-4-dehydrorhamnose reductase